MKPTILTEVLVGSRLHGLHTPLSDWDYRGIHIHPLKEVLSPFKTLKNTSWIEGDVDNTSYELADFCKQATHGNATILEVFFSDHIEKSSPIADEMRANWQKFIDMEKFVMASRGYAHNQYNKFYSFESQGVKGQERTAKFAIAYLRVMWQCEQFLLTGRFECTLVGSDIYDLCKLIKPLTVAELQPHLPEIMGKMQEMQGRVTVAHEATTIHYTPDIEWIEDFIYRAYTR